MTKKVIWDCENCGKVDKISIDGYGTDWERQLEGVIFVVDKGYNPWKVISRAEDEDYLDKFDIKKLHNVVREAAAQGRSSECARCGGEIAEE